MAGRATQVSVEVLFESSTSAGRATQVTVEALVSNSAYAISPSETLSLSDAVSIFLDTAGGIGLEFSDRLNIFESALLIPFVNDDPTVQIFETLYFQDEAIVAEVKTQDKSDTLDLSDDISIQAVGSIEAYDSQFYNWAEDVKVVLEVQLTFSDTLSLSDAVSTAVVIIAINQTPSDTLSLSDTIAILNLLAKSFEDNISLADAHQRLNNAFLLINDTIALSDGLNLFVGAVPDFSDAVSLTDDVTVVLTIPLTVVVSDTLALSDTTSVLRLGTISSYLRRYLNDIPSSMNRA